MEAVFLTKIKRLYFKLFQSVLSKKLDFYFQLKL